MDNCQLGACVASLLFGSGPMNLDVNTLFLVTIYVEAILGLLLLFAWVQNTAHPRGGVVGLGPSVAGRFDRAVRHVRFGFRR